MSNSSDRNKRIKEILLKTINDVMVSHAYLFSGGDSSSRKDVADWLASALFCSSDNPPCGECLACRKFAHGNQEDLILIGKPDDKESISAEQVNNLIERLSYKPYGDRYVVIIEDAQLITTAAQNKLLKTLEEPASEAVIILLCVKEEDLLETVRSRCVKFVLEDEGSLSSDELKSIAKAFGNAVMNNAPYYKAKEAIKPLIPEKDIDRKQVLEFLDVLEELFIGAMKKNASGSASLNAAAIDKMSNGIRQIENCRKNINQGHSTPYSLKQLCLRI